MTAYTGTAGNDTQNGTAGTDTFDYSQGGKDTLDGRGGDDFFIMGAALDAADSIQGGSGVNVVILNGDYSAGLTFGATTILNVDTLQLIVGHDYTLTLDNANVTLGDTIRIDGTALGAGDQLIFDGSAETSSAITVSGGAAADTIWTGAGNDPVTGGGGFNTIHTGDGNDVIDVSGSKHNAVFGGDDDDHVYAGARFRAGATGDVIDGGTGKDALELNGDYAAGVLFAADTIRNIERITADAGHSYNLILHNGNLDFGDALTIDGSALGVADNLTVDGSAITEGRLKLIGGSGGDILAIGQSGEDIVRAGGDKDTIVAGAHLTETVRLNGGEGTDVLVLYGDYSDRLQFLSHTMRDIEAISIIDGDFNYNLATADGNVAAGQMLTVDGSILSSDRKMTFDGSAESNGSFLFLTSNASHRLTGGAQDDTFDVQAGGASTLSGGGGNDTFLMAAGLNSLDAVDGGSGNDTVEIVGDYSSPLVVSSQIMSNVENLVLGPGFDYNFLISGDGIGSTFTVDASALGASDTTFIGITETPVICHFRFIGGAGDDVFGISSNNAGNTYDLSLGGDDRVDGGNRGNAFYMGDALTAADTITGVTPFAFNDVMILDGDYAGVHAVVFGPDTVTHIDTIELVGGYDYSLTMDDHNLAAGRDLTIGFQTPGLSGRLDFDASAETNGNYIVSGGNDSDTITCGSGNDEVFAAGGADVIEGGAGADTFEYRLVPDSTSAGFDVIAVLNFNEDAFHLVGVSPLAIDSAVTSGSLSTATFDAGLAAKISAARLHLGNAVLYTPDNGTLAGHTFLIVDANGTAGYQPGADYVVDVTGSTGSLDTGDFI